MGLTVPMKNLPHIQEGKESGDTKGGQSDAPGVPRGRVQRPGNRGLAAEKRGMGGRWALKEALKRLRKRWFRL